MEVFWRKGFDGTSITDLTEAMGINRPSLYAAYGDKESLFRKVLDRYGEGPGGYFGEALLAPTAREAARAVLRGAAAVQTGEGRPRGCLAVRGALSCGDAGAGVEEELQARWREMMKALTARFDRAKEEGDLPGEASAEGLARYVGTLVGGMAVMAAGGASKEELEGVIETGMRGWPG